MQIQNLPEEFDARAAAAKRAGHANPKLGCMNLASSRNCRCWTAPARPRPASPGVVRESSSCNNTWLSSFSSLLPSDPPSTAETNDGVQTFILGEGGSRCDGEDGGGRRLAKKSWNSPHFLPSIVCRTAKASLQDGGNDLLPPLFKFRRRHRRRRRLHHPRARSAGEPISWLAARMTKFSERVPHPRTRTRAPAPAFAPNPRALFPQLQGFPL